MSKIASQYNIIISSFGLICALSSIAVIISAAFTFEKNFKSLDERFGMSYEFKNTRKELSSLSHNQNLILGVSGTSILISTTQFLASVIFLANSKEKSWVNSWIIAQVSLCFPLLFLYVASNGLVINNFSEQDVHTFLKQDSEKKKYERYLMGVKTWVNSKHCDEVMKKEPHIVCQDKLSFLDVKEERDYKDLLDLLTNGQTLFPSFLLVHILIVIFLYLFTSFMP